MIDIEHLNKIIKHRQVLCDVSMHIAPGTVAGLRGPNGSGKTMLMRTVVGLVRPTSGRITVQGCNPWEHTNRFSRARGFAKEGAPQTQRDASSPNKWPTLGLLLEGPAFLDNLTGYENLKILADVKRLPLGDTVRASLKSVGLDPDDRRRYRAYSLGMRQRLGIAGAILGNPEVLVLDEPTNALDDDGVGLVVALIRQAAEQGAAIMLACHDADVLRELSHEIWHMNEGHIVQHETLKDVPVSRHDDAPGDDAR